MHFLLTLFCAALAHAVLCFPNSAPRGEVQVLYRFSNNSWVENLAVRANGQILVSLLTGRELFLVDPQHPGRASVVYNFTEAHAVTGIVEFEPDVFAVITGNYSFGTPNYGNGTWTLWRVDLGGTGSGAVASSAPIVTKIVHIPEAGLLNGVSLLSAERKTLLVGDSRVGVIYRVDTTTGTYRVVINSTYTSPLDTPHGVNGLHVHDGHILYLANSGQEAIYKLPIRPDGTAAGNASVVARPSLPLESYDDFAVDCDGNLFVPTGDANSVKKISDDGVSQLVIAGGLNSSAVAGPTSAAFGRGRLGRSTLYIATSGGLTSPVNGTTVLPGSLLSIRTDSRGCR